MIKNCWQFVSCSSIHFFVILSKLNIFAFFYILTFNTFFFIYRLFACSRCICFYWIDWLYSFIIVSTQYNAILLTSLNTLSFALLDLCFDFNFILFFIIFCDFFYDYLHKVYIFSGCFISFSSWVASEESL